MIERHGQFSIVRLLQHRVDDRDCGQGGRKCLEDTIARARHYGDKARDALGFFPASEEQQALVDVVDFCIERAH